LAGGDDKGSRRNMPPKFAVRFRAICVAVALASATALTVHAAAAKDPLIGATREQVLAKYGEPKNTIVAGNREVLLFERDRVTLRDNVVIQVERLPEPVRHTPEPAPAPAPVAATSATPTQSTSANNAPATATTTPAPAATTSTTSTASTPPASAAPDPEAPLEIKVRSAGAHPVTKAEPAASTPAPAPAATTAVIPATKPVEKSTAPAPVTPAIAVAPATTPPVASTTTPSPATTATTTAPATESTAQAAPATKAGEAPKAAEETPAATPAEPAKTDETAAAADDKKEKAKAKKPAHRRLDDGDVADEPVITTSTYVIGAVIIGAGVAFIIWRMRQRQLELAASAVSRTPFSAPVATSSGGGAVFTADLLGKLEWKRFEELVAAYYSKTGVVAARTKTGPASPVHIKISWKGEPRPFALVQCISHPAGLIDATRLQELVAVLGAEDIRRGYVVTTGKFNVPARDFAEEKHITLMSGDIFLEKINALPGSARTELVQEFSGSDNSTPTCPKCDTKMVPSPGDPAVWVCTTHPEVKKPAWK
jgi:hypothetical protein